MESASLERMKKDGRMRREWPLMAGAGAPEDQIEKD